MGKINAKVRSRGLSFEPTLFSLRSSRRWRLWSRLSSGADQYTISADAHTIPPVRATTIKKLSRGLLEQAVRDHSFAAWSRVVKESNIGGVWLQQQRHDVKTTATIERSRVVEHFTLADQLSARGLESLLTHRQSQVPLRRAFPLGEWARRECHNLGACWGPSRLLALKKTTRAVLEWDSSRPATKFGANSTRSVAESGASDCYHGGSSGCSSSGDGGGCCPGTQVIPRVGRQLCLAADERATSYRAPPIGAIGYGSRRCVNSREAARQRRLTLSRAQNYDAPIYAITIIDSQMTTPPPPLSGPSI